MWGSFEQNVPKGVSLTLKRQLFSLFYWMRENLTSAAGTRTTNGEAATSMLPGMGVRPNPANGGSMLLSTVAAGCCGAHMGSHEALPTETVYDKCEGEIDVLLNAAENPVAGSEVWVDPVTPGFFTSVNPVLYGPCGLILDASMYAATQRVRIQGMFPFFGFQIP